MAFFPITFFIVKVHSRCNLNCDYCYEYNLGNSGWTRKPKFMSIAVFRCLCERIAEHSAANNLNEQPFISFHGGEPLLRSPEFFDAAMTLARELIPDVRFGMQTNGTLLNSEFLDVFLKHGLRAGVSLDGPEAINDRHRLGHKGQGSFKQVMQGLEHFRHAPRREAWGGLLSVIDVHTDAVEQIEFFADLDPPGFDLLEPDGNWEKLPPGKRFAESTEFADWLIRAFDHWFDHRSNLRLRRFDEIIESMFGGRGTVEYFGVEPAPLITVATDGAYEAVDQIKSAFDGAEELGLNVHEHSLDEVVRHPKVQERLTGFASLANQCRQCRHRLSCGGGYYPHRYSTANEFRNPSIYCADYLRLFDHISARLQEELAA